MPRKKGTKKAGDQVGFKLKEDESPLILDWVNEQSIFAESIRYLIEKEIAENGIRDLKQVMKQGFSYYRHNPVQNLKTVKTAPTPSPVEYLNNNSIKNSDTGPSDLNVATSLQGEHQQGMEIRPMQEPSIQPDLREATEEVPHEQESLTTKLEMDVQQENNINEKAIDKEGAVEERQNVQQENNEPKKGPRARRKTNLFG